MKTKTFKPLVKLLVAILSTGCGIVVGYGVALGAIGILQSIGLESSFWRTVGGMTGLFFGLYFAQRVFEWSYE